MNEQGEKQEEINMLPVTRVLYEGILTSSQN
jgi:hypothetical protein